MKTKSKYVSTLFCTTLLYKINIVVLLIISEPLSLTFIVLLVLLVNIGYIISKLLLNS